MTEKEREATVIPPTFTEDVERASCPACVEHRWHTESEWKNHPRAGSGISKQ